MVIWLGVAPAQMQALQSQNYNTTRHDALQQQQQEQPQRPPPRPDLPNSMR
jgi:hypothetical protein